MSLRPRLHELVSGFVGRRVVLYGDMVLDRFILGSPKRISREAPVIILRFERQEDIPGGGANALANIAALGGQARPVGVVGEDEAGACLLTELQERGVNTSSIIVIPGFRTVTKVRVLAGGPTSLRHQVARYDMEDEVGEVAKAHESLLAALTKAAQDADAAAISDYGYGVVSPAGIVALHQSLPKKALTVADSRFALTALGQVDGATPNAEELQSLTDEPLTSDESVAIAATALRHRLGARFVLATRGNRGMTLVEDGHAALHLPVFGTDQVADVTGAGDTVLATLTLALASGASPREAAYLADLAGGIVVTKLGTATVSPAELHRAIDVADFINA